MSLPSNAANEKVFLSLKVPVAVTAGGNGTGVSCTNCCQELIWITHVGASAGTSPTLNLKLQSSINDNTASAAGAADAYADITGASIDLTSSDANTIIVRSVVVRNETYVRLVTGTPGGSSTPGFTFGSVLEATKLRL
jgi:hypothetical protein